MLDEDIDGDAKRAQKIYHVIRARFSIDSAGRNEVISKQDENHPNPAGIT